MYREWRARDTVPIHVVDGKLCIDVIPRGIPIKEIKTIKYSYPNWFYVVLCHEGVLRWVEINAGKTYSLNVGWFGDAEGLARRIHQVLTEAGISLPAPTRS